MGSKTIFISHSTKNDSETDRIADWLEKAGFGVWVDHRGGIEPGTPSWDKAIREAIMGADAGLLVMTSDSLESDICGSECLLVRQLEIPLYILKLEDVAPSSIWLYIKLIQHADLRQDFEAGMQALVGALDGKADGNAPQAVLSKFTGMSTLRQYLPYLFLKPMRGRDEDLQRLSDSLKGVVQVTGTGGLGKSRLAAEVALKHEAGAVWYRCSPVSSAADLQGLLLEHLRLAKDSSEQELLDHLRREGGTLIVIDNAEAVSPAERAGYQRVIAQLQAAGALVIVTSRVRWEALQGSKEITPRTLDGESATQIARDFGDAQGIELSEAQAATMAEAARLYPRLIEWAIGQLGKRPFERVVAQLRDLKSKGVQEALEEMIGSSLQQMTKQEGGAAEHLLRRLVVCEGAFDYEALTALKPNEMDEAILDEALDALQAWRFVRFERGEERYSVDAMVRISLGEADESTYRAYFRHYHSLHSDYDLNQAHAADGSMLRHGALEQDWAHIRRAIEWGLAHETETAVDWVVALDSFMRLRRSAQERQALLTRAHDAAQSTGYTWGEAQCLHRLGEAHLMLNANEAAVERYEAALELYRTIGNRLGEANCLLSLGDVKGMLSEYGAAVENYEAALALYRTIGNRLGEANCLQSLGDVQRMQAEFGAAVERYEAALELYRTIGDRLGEANCLRSLGDVQRMQNNYGAAVERYEAALALYRTIGDRMGEANCLKSLGDVQRMQDDYEAAVEHYEDALALYRTIGERLGEAHCLQGLGDVQRMQGEHEAAIEHYEAALELGKDIGDFSSQLNSLRGLAFSYRAQGKAALACRYAQATLTLADQHPFFSSHPLVEEWRATFASWGCGGEAGA